MDKIIENDIEKEVKTCFLNYSMSVIVARALPDLRDGLKPVHRRIYIQCTKPVILLIKLIVKVPELSEM